MARPKGSKNKKGGFFSKAEENEENSEPIQESEPSPEAAPEPEDEVAEDKPAPEPEKSGPKPARRKMTGNVKDLPKRYHKFL
jgi:hypothetical protein